MSALVSSSSIRALCSTVNESFIWLTCEFSAAISLSLLRNDRLVACATLHTGTAAQRKTCNKSRQYKSLCFCYRHVGYLPLHVLQYSQYMELHTPTTISHYACNEHKLIAGSLCQTLLQQCKQMLRIHQPDEFLVFFCIMSDVVYS